MSEQKWNVGDAVLVGINREWASITEAKRDPGFVGGWRYAASGRRGYFAGEFFAAAPAAAEPPSEHCPKCHGLLTCPGSAASCTCKPLAEPVPQGEPKFGDDQIKRMVNRFLTWRLPENFNPDGGISFKPIRNESTPYPAKNEPVGTNLFDYSQAEEMVRYLLAAPSQAETLQTPTDVEFIAMIGDASFTSIAAAKKAWGAALAIRAETSQASMDLAVALTHDIERALTYDAGRAWSESKVVKAIDALHRLRDELGRLRALTQQAIQGPGK